MQIDECFNDEHIKLEQYTSVCQHCYDDALSRIAKLEEKLDVFRTTLDERNTEAKALRQALDEIRKLIHESEYHIDMQLIADIESIALNKRGEIMKMGNNHEPLTNLIQHLSKTEKAIVFIHNNRTVSLTLQDMKNMLDQIKQLEQENEKYSKGMSENCDLRKQISKLEQVLDEIQQSYQMLRDQKYDAQTWCESSIVWDELIAKQARER